MDIDKFRTDTLEELTEYFKNLEHSEYFKDFKYKKVSDHDKFRKEIIQKSSQETEEEVSKKIIAYKEAYVKSIAYQTLVSGDRFKELIKTIKNELENNYSSVRCFCEVIQNVDDCSFEENPSLTIKYSVLERTIELSYNEKGFDFKDIYGICSYGVTTKKVFDIKGEKCVLKLDDIEQVNVNSCFSRYRTGEKGVGFKAIYKIAKQVDIQSNGFYISLFDEYPMAPIWKNKEAYLDDKTTYLKIYLKEKISDYELDINKLIKDLKKEYFCTTDSSINNPIINNNLLFTKKLHKVTIINKENEEEYVQFTIENEKYTLIKNQDIDNDDNTIYGEGIVIFDDSQSQNRDILSAKCEFEFCVYGKDKQLKFPKVKLLKYIETVEISSDSVKKRYGSKAEEYIKNYKIENEINENITFYAQAQRRNISFIIMQNESIKKNGSFYSTLPLNTMTNMPFSVDAPFILNQERSDIDMPENDDICAWNCEVFNKIKQCYSNFLMVIRDQTGIVCNCINGSSVVADVHNNIITKENYKTKLWEIINTKHILRKYNSQIEYVGINVGCCFEEKWCYELPCPEKIIEIVNNGKVLLSEEYLSLKINEVTKYKFKEIWGKWNDYIELFTETNVEYSLNKLFLYLKNSSNALFEYLINNKLKIGEDKKILLLNNNIVSENELLRHPYELIIYKDDNIDLNHSGCFFNMKKLLSGFNDRFIDIFPNAIIFDNDSIIQKLEEKLEKFSKSENNLSDNTVKEYYQAVFDGCCKYLQNSLMENIHFSEIYRFGKLGINGEKQTFEDIFEPFLLHIREDEINEEFVNKWNNLVKKADINKRAKYICNNFSHYDNLSNNPVGAMLAVLFSGKEDSTNKIELSCKIKDIIDVLYWYANEINNKKVNDFLKKNYYCWLKSLNNWFIISIQLEEGCECKKIDDNNNDAIKIIKEYCNEKNKENDNTNLQELARVCFKAVKCNDNRGILYIIAQNTVYCLADNVNECISEFADDFLGKNEKIIKNRLSYTAELERLEEFISNSNNDSKKKFVDFLHNHRKNQCNSGFDVRNITSQLIDGDSEVWLEILQNINDAREGMSDEDKKSDINIFLNSTEKAIKIEYKEKGFSFKDVAAITDLGNGAKLDDGNTTGEKGIGFKNIFRWCNVVEIHSNGFHFTIGDTENKKTQIEKCTIPTWKEFKEQHNTENTIFIFYLNSNQKLEEIEKKILDENAYLCLNNCVSFAIKYSNSDNHLKIINVEEKRKNHYSYSISLDDAVRLYYEKIFEWMKRRKKWSSKTNEKDYKKILFEWMKRRKKWSSKTNEQLDVISKNAKIQYYFIGNLKDEKWREKEKNVGYYATLPFDGVDENSSIIINAPFQMNMARTNKIKKSDYNKKLLTLIKGNFKNAIKYAKKTLESGGSSLCNLEGNLLFYFRGKDTEIKAYRNILLHMQLFSCMKKDNNEWKECKCKVSEILKINNDSAVYELLENLNDNNFCDAIPKKEDCHIHPRDSLLDFLVNSKKEKAVLIKTKETPINEIKLYISDEQNLQVEECIGEWIKEIFRDDYKYEENLFFHTFIKVLKEYFEYRKILAKETRKETLKIPVYPYISNLLDGKKETHFTSIDGSVKWYFSLNKDMKSEDYYKIVDLDWLSKNFSKNNPSNREQALSYFDTYGLKEITEFKNGVVINHLKEKIENMEERYSDIFWNVLRQIYDLEKGDQNNE